MDEGEVRYLRQRIEAERKMARTASCDETAALHLRMVRLYEGRIEDEARRIIDRSHPVDDRIDEAIRRMS